MNKDSKIYIAGHRGLVGSAILRKLEADGYTNLIYITSEDMDLTNQEPVERFFHKHRPEYVFLVAARAGGVHALNTHQADSMYLNLCIQNNVIHNSYKYGVKKLLFIGSNCVYPRFAVRPLKEEYLLAGTLEPTTEYYAIAKIAGVKMCEAYRLQYGCNFVSVLPVNMYGVNDNATPEHAHVMIALLTRFKNAVLNNEPTVEIWGTGNAQREFLHVDDMIDAAMLVMDTYNELGPINIGSGIDTPIRELAEIIKEVSGYTGEIVFNSQKPDGVTSKVFDISRIEAMGWSPKIGLREGIKKVYDVI